MKTLRIGLLLDSTRANKYVHELLAWAKAQPDIEISHLIVHPRRDASALGKLKELARTRRLHTLPAKLLFRLVVGLENRLLARDAVHKDHFRSRDLAGMVDDIVTITPLVSPSGYVYRFGDADIQKVKALKLDLLIRCGSGILRGAILRASRLGILSFHHGDNRVNRGGPAGFWECYYRRPRTGFIIQRLTEELDAGEVLLRGFYRTRRFYSLNQAYLYKKSLAHMKSLLAKLAKTGELPPCETEPAPYSNPLFRVPNLAQCIAYGCKLLTRLFAYAAGRWILPRERWGISVLHTPWDKAALWRSTENPPPRGHFWADPFLATRHGRTFCFVEDFVFKEGKAHIAALELHGTRLVERGVALKEPFHLSFPFLFEYRGSLYMCPEAAHSGQVRVYRCTEFPLKWTLESILMDGVPAADTVLFEKAGKWWLLTSIDQSGSGEFCSELYLFSGDSPLGTAWRAHPRNPLRIDSFGGRNAGLIVEGERIYRLAQRQGYDRYGHSLLAYEITEISESHYAERLVTRIGPGFRKGILGTHHLSSDGRVTVVDHVSRSLRSSRRGASAQAPVPTSAAPHVRASTQKP